MGALSPPSFFFEDLLARFLVAIGVGDERVSDGTGSDMVKEDGVDDNTVDGFAVMNTCCILFRCW